MKKVNITYWLITGLFAAFMLFSSIPDIMVTAESVTFMKNGLGYPIYIIPFLGVAKLLGVIAILIPGFPRIKEWAYAGLVFDLLGATYSVAAAGNSHGMWMFNLLPLAFAAASYVLYHKKAQAKSMKKSLSMA